MGVFTRLPDPIFLAILIVIGYGADRFVCAHLTAHEPKLAHRIADYHHIVGSLLFDAPSPSAPQTKSTIYATSHLFFLGDLNFRLALPHTHAPVASVVGHMHEESAREALKEYDQLLVARRQGAVCVGLREGAFWQFQCSYKYLLGEVDRYRCVQYSNLTATAISLGSFVWLMRGLGDIVRRGLRRGRIGLCTRRTPIPRTRRRNRTSRTCCIRLSRLTPLLTTYVPFPPPSPPSCPCS